MEGRMEWRRGLCAGLVLFAVWGNSPAIEPYQEYRKRIESSQNLTALKSDLFGDSVSLYNGKTDFIATDIDLPGNDALPVRLQRRFSVEIHLAGTATNFNSSLEGAGGWDVDVPYISGTFAPISGWSDQRCSVSMVPTVSGGFRVSEIWQGNTIHVPGDGDRTMLGLESQTPRPSDGVSRKWTTRQRDAIDCIPMQSGLSGEGFRVTTTDGKRYFFDIAVSRYAGTLEKQMSPNLPPLVIGRSKVYLLASKVEDRFGNTVQYQYSSEGYPTRIWSSDGREILLTYSGGQLASASAAGRTLTYQYGTVEGSVRLTRVVRPDGSNWRYTYSNALSPSYTPWDGNSRSDCSEQPPEVTADFTLTIEHPSGAVGSFDFSNARQYRSGVHMSECLQRISESTYYYELSTPNFFDVMSLQSKRITGPGLGQPLIWTYAYGGSYQPLWGSRSVPAAYPCQGCATEKLVTVGHPDGTRTNYRYGFQYALNEGRLLGSARLDPAGYEVSTNSTTYMSESQVAGHGFAPRFGTIYNGDDPSTAQVRPVTGTVIQQDGDAYHSVNNSFDSLARPLSVTRSGPWSARIDVTEYHDNTSRWILGQAAKITNADTGLIVSTTTFDSNDMPYQAWAFGKLQQTLTYRVDGTVATVKDGNDNVTTLSGWKRGVPQSIAHAGGTGQSAVVDDNGWITKVIDENGFATNYTYDEMGLLESIVWPIGDSTVWSTTTQAFEPVAIVEYGIAAGHWRQTVSTGNARKVTYFDALWRPLLTREFDAANEAETRRLQRFTYDPDGRVTFASYPGTSDALSTGTWTEYDTLGRLSSLTQDSELGPLTTLSEYLTGNRTRVTNPKGFATVTTYQALDEPIKAHPVAIEHPAGAYTDIVRDVFGKPTTLRRRDGASSISSTRQYVYNSHQLLCKVIEPETGATVMDYDAAGNLSWSASGQGYPSAGTCNTLDVAANQMVTRGYDVRNRLTTLTFPDGRGNQTWDYSADGLPSLIATNNVAGGGLAINTYSYNKRRLLVGETLGVGSQLWSVGYDYDANGHLAAHIYPSGLSVDYAPNALGQATKAGAYASAVGYFSNGAIKQFTYGNGIAHTLTQNLRGLPERSRDAYGSTAFHDDSLDYDGNGNVAAISDGLSGTRGNRDMSYDALDRLTGTLSPMFGTATYTYDVLDNLKSVKLTAGSKVRDHAYIYDAGNRLANVTNTANATVIGLSYDARGNLENKNGQLYDFDFGNRLRQATASEQYFYDGHGRRVLATPPVGGSIFSFYGQDGTLRFQRNERAGKSIDYVHLSGSLVAQVEQPLPLTVPTLNAPSYSNTGSYTVNWTSVPLAIKYQLQERLGSGSWATIHDGTGTGDAILGRAAGLYSYQVRACHAAACGSWSAAAQTAVELAPSTAPTLNAPDLGLSGNYTVSWNAVAAANDYRLEESPNGGAWISAQVGASLSKAYAGKTAGEYTYRVKACNQAGCSPVSTAKVVQAMYPTDGVPVLSAPATNTTGAYIVSWTSVTGASSYSLEEQANSGAWTQMQVAAGTNRSVSGQVAGTYAYRVRACNAAGCGAYSNSGSTQVVFAPASAPTQTVPPSSSTGAYTVSWTTAATATSYRLEEQLSGGAWTQLQDAAGTSRAISGKANGTYGYRVRACNIGGCSGYSAVGNIVVTLPPTGAPDLSVPASNSSGSFTVSWTAVATAASYRVEEQVNGGSWTQVQDAGGTGRTVSGKGSGTYGYRVRACNVGGCGSYSGASSVIVTLPPGSAPSLTLPSSSLTGTYTISWSAIGSSTRYELDERLGTGAWSRIHDAALTSKAVSGKTTGSWGYQVRACNDGGCGPFSAIGAIDVTRPPTAAPALSVPTSSTSSSYAISWTAVANAGRYELQERLNGGGWSLVLDGAGTGTAVAGKTTGTWGYQVRACNAAGCGAFSAIAEVTVTLPPATPTITYSLKKQWIISGRTQIQCSLKWTPVTGADRYELQVYNGVLQYSGPLTSVTGAYNTAVFCGASHIVRTCNLAGCSAWSAPPYPQAVETYDMDNPQ